MDRGHRTFALKPLLAILILANPALAGRPGERSRQWAKNAKPDQNVENAVELRGPNASAKIKQVVGKQPGTRKVDPNRSLFIPALVGTNNAKPLNGQRRSTGTRSNANNRKSVSSRQGSRGLLGEIFGQQSSQANKQRSPSNTSNRTASKSAAPAPQENTQRTIDWEGIPYHQARSNTPSTRAPIRDPRPGETRMATSSPPRLADAPGKSILAPRNLPKPPALQPVPRTTRRPSANVASSRLTQSNSSPIFAASSSSRRSDRIDVPSLDASEVAAARTDQFGKDELVPKVSRKRIKVDVTESAVAAATGSTRRAKPEPKPTATPSAEVAVKPEIAKAPEPKTETPAPPQVATTEQPVEPTHLAAESAPSTVAVAQSQPATATTPAPALPTPSSKTAMAQPPQVAQLSDLPSNRDVAQTNPQPIVASQPTVASQPSPIASPSDRSNVTDNFTAHQSRVPASFASVPKPSPAMTPSLPATQTIPAQPLPTPALPTFQNSIAAHHPEPSASAFENSFPRAESNDPRHTMTPPVVGSGIQVPAARVATNPYPSDPYLTPTPAAPNNRSVPSNRSVASAPQVPNNPSLPSGAPQLPPPVDAAPTATGFYSNHRAAMQAAPARPEQPVVSNVVTSPPATTPKPTIFDRAPDSTLRHDPIPSPSDTANTMRNPTPDPMSSLQVGTTAVASELPGLRVLTHGPASIVIRETHEFEIRAENRGAIDVSGLVIRTHVPKWAQVKSQNATQGAVEAETLAESDRLVWQIDSLPAGKSEKLIVRLQAVEAGKHGLDVEWTLMPQKSVATVQVQEPKLELLIEGPDNVVYGESQTYKVRVLNPGDGPAPNVVFTLSPNSPTPQSQRIGNIPSGKEAQFEVELTAQDLGNLKIHGLASGDLNLSAQAEKTIRVDAAQLEAILSGPEVKYQNTEGFYALELSNQGTATSKTIVATMQLPQGMSYIGGLDGAAHRAGRLTWTVDSLPPGAKRLYEFKCNLNQPGTQVIQFAAEGSAAGQASVALDTRVESISDLVMTIQDPVAPAPVGTEVTYEIVIKNRGSREALGVRAIAQFSHGIEPRRVQGHPGQVLTGQVLFDPIPSIPAGGEVRIRVMAEAEREGHHRFRTEIRSGETVLVAEEATHYMSKRTERVSRRSENSSAVR